MASGTPGDVVGIIRLKLCRVIDPGHENLVAIFGREQAYFETKTNYDMS